MADQMTPEEIGRRALAAGLEWVPGMRDTAGRLVFGVSGSRAFAVVEMLPLLLENPPDLTDPGTAGHALAQVRKRWGRPTLHLTALATKGVVIWEWDWAVGEMGLEPFTWGEFHTEAEALLAALEAPSASID